MWIVFRLGNKYDLAILPQNMGKAKSTILTCLVLMSSCLFVPSTSGNTPGVGDYIIHAPSAEPILNFSEHGIYFTTGESCDDIAFGKGTSRIWHICDFESKSTIYSYSSYTRLTPVMYNETIILVNGDQKRPDFGEKNEIFGINIETGVKEFTINSPWRDGGVIHDAIISPDGRLIAFVRGGCTQIWSMEAMANEHLFSDFDGSSNTYCSKISSDSYAFSPDGSIYVGYEPSGYVGSYASGGLAAYSTTNWSKLGLIQELTTNELRATNFIFAGDSAYYLEKGGWERWPTTSQYEKEIRIVNNLIKIDLSKQSNLWNQDSHNKVYFGTTEKGGPHNKFLSFSNHQINGTLYCSGTASADWDSVETQNRVELIQIRPVTEYNSILVYVNPVEHACSKSFETHGWVLLSNNGTVLSELPKEYPSGDEDCESQRPYCKIEIKLRDSDDDGTPDYLDGAPLDPRDTVDSDGDYVGDSNDAFPFNPNQTEDRDGDGFGDTPFKEDSDIFPDDPTQWFDSDGDGWGDNPEGYNPDMFPDDREQWNDSDGDGYGDNLRGLRIDFFPNDPTRWADSDIDGFADEDDQCPFESGFSTIDRPGCPDQDGDGVSDLNDVEPENPDVSLEAYSNEGESAGSSVIYLTSALAGLFAAAVIVRLRRGVSREDRQDESNEELENLQNFSTINQEDSTHLSPNSASNLPEYSMSGIQHESGYEVLEFPEGSERWWWKDEENQCWVSWE